MADGTRFPDDMLEQSSFHDDDKILISDSQDAKKAKWWSLAALKTWFSSFFANITGSNVTGTDKTAWQTQLEIAILRDEIDDLTGGDAFSVTTNSVNATSSGTTNLPATNKIGILKVFHYGSLQYLTYNTWQNDAMEYWSTYYNGSTWGTWINLTATVSPQDWVDMVPQSTAAPHQEGRFYYDNVRKSFVAYNDESEVSLNIGSEIWGRLDNVNAYSLLNGKVGYVRGSSGSVLDCDLMDASLIDNSIRGIGLFTHDIETGTFGYVTRLGVVRDFDTTDWEEGDVLWADPDNVGEMVNVRPVAPNYPVRIGMVLVKHVTLGAVVVDTIAFTGTDTSVNIEGIINGIVTQSPNVVFSVSGGIIYATVSNEAYPANDLPFMLHDTRYHLDTTTAALQIAVPPGPDTENTQKSLLYIYLDTGVPTLAIATTEPAMAYAPIGDVIVFNAARTDSEGKPAGYRRSNNAIDLINGINDGGLGIITDLLAAFREKLGSNWNTGQDATETINDTTIKVVMSAGTGRQFRKSTLPAFDGNSYLIYNDDSNQITYEASVNLTDIVSDANGNSLLNPGTYYTIRLFYQLNSNGVGNSVIATRPLGSYSTAALAQSDGLNYAVALGDINIEELIWPLYDIIIERTGGGGATITLVELRNRRSKLATGGSGGGAAQGTSTDDKVRISATDTINDFLTAKLVNTDGIIKTILNPAVNEQIQLGVDPTWMKKATGNHFIAGAGQNVVPSFSSNLGIGVNVFAYNGAVNFQYTVGIGDGALFALTSGAGSIVIGNESAEDATDLEHFTIVGTQSGRALTTGQEGGIFIGYNAGDFETGNYKLFISSLTTATQVNEATARTKAIIYGVQSNTTASQTLAFNAQISMPYTLSVLGDTAIGGASASEKLHVFGNIRADNGSVYCNLNSFGLDASNNGANYQKCITAAGYWIWRVNGSATDVMILNTNGYLGIGTVPNSLLHLKSTSAGVALTIDASLASHNASVNFSINGVSKWDLRTTGSTDNLGIFDGTNYKFYIDRTTGNIGLGGIATTTSALNVTGLPTSSAGLVSGDEYTQTLTQIGLSGTAKVVMIV